MHSKDGWKPLSLSVPVLVTLTAFTLLIAASIETIAQRSKAQGGLALSPSLDEMPRYAWLAYLYVPNIVAVIYSTLWSWVDLDAKRMQPWFELSKPQGATAKDSIFLDYPYDFVAFVPFRAARRKHWPVFFSGTAMVIVFWLITPLQSAILGTDSVVQKVDAQVGVRSELQALQQQETLLNTEILNTGYAIGWLDQPYPPFTTSSYALLPFYLEDTSVPAMVQSNWTANTTKLSTELSCWPADVVPKSPKNTSTSFYFLNGQGCNATIGFNQWANYTMLYIGYYGSPYSDFWLGGPKCVETANSTHQFLAIWAKPGPFSAENVTDIGTPQFNITAIYCQPRYYKQQVLATVESSTLKPVNSSIRPVGPIEPLTEQEFNSTAFEFLLGNGITDVITKRDYPFISVVEQQPRLNDTGIDRPASNMVGYALAGRDLPVTAYSDPKTLAKVYGDAHRHLFSVAINQLLINNTETSEPTGSAEFYLYGVVVSRVFATIVESLLGVIACFTLLLMWLSRNSWSNLPHNPSSLRRYIDITRDSPEILRQFRGSDTADEKTLIKESEKGNYKLLYDTSSNSVRVTLDNAQPNTLESPQRKQDSQRGFYDPVQPWILKRRTGTLLVIALIAAITILSYFKQQESKLNGLKRPSNNFEVLQLLENYIPTIFATLIEPLWILLNRTICVLQPFKELWEGKARSDVSIDATYTSIPPQLVLWRAIKSRHLTLVTLCTVALLANVLSVGLSSVFNEAPTVAVYTETLQPAFAPQFDNSSVYNFESYMVQNIITTAGYRDHYYVALANISSGTTLPPWVSKDFFFHRYDLPQIDQKKGDIYKLQTRGFGVSANCTPIPSYKWPANLTVPETDEKSGKCADLVDTAIVNMRENHFDRSTGVSAIEYIATLTSGGAPQPCDLPLTLGWGRTTIATQMNGSIFGGFVVCRPYFQTAMFNVTVDISGHILEYNQTSDMKSALDYPESKTHTDILFEQANHQWRSFNNHWHNNTLSNDWMNHFIMLLTGSRASLDPSGPPPEPKDMLPMVEYLYGQLFVILLSLNEHIFVKPDTSNVTTATRHTQEVRIFMENASLYISIAVLGLNIIVALGFYFRSVAFVLPRMPTTLGSILAYIAPSRLASSKLKQLPGQDSRTFSFGRYVGLDGRSYIGVELDPYVVPVDPSMRKYKSGLVAWIGSLFRKREKYMAKNETWL
ncbi:hypothetical protein BGZ63DRAFT_356587 [Mariannaea sp. PMI_226]|nr:hypothetical protein BGZ63DRAFT_356587 [Mariannaea sp. PMI_226]